MTDRLFDVAEVPHALTLADRFLVPPFSVLDTKIGWWQDRKREWRALGLRSEQGRAARSYGSGATVAGMTADAVTESLRTIESTADKVAWLVERGVDEVTAKVLAVAGGQSVFDPVICEVAYRWYAPPGGLVLDPFAGGSARGVVAGFLGRRYIGVDLSADQIDENRAQRDEIVPDADVSWIVGDSAKVLGDMAYPIDADLVFSCPPYADLEVYSDDPDDLSNMPWPQFLEMYRRIIAESVRHLADDRFALWVIGEVRGPDGAYRGLVPETIRAFEDAGAAYYNEAIILTATGTTALRAATPFVGSRKLAKTHQTLQVFVKGDPKRAAANLGDVEIPGL